MRLAWILAITVLCLVPACSGEEEPGASATAPPAVGDPGTRLPAVGAASPERAYTCADGTSFSARIEREHAVVTLQENTFELAHSEQAAGPQYSGEGITYLVQGNDAILERAGAPAVRCSGK
jgi:membrane-bound inhibitor of C-type lysozyme